MRLRLVAPTADFSDETLAAIADDLARLARPGLELEHVQVPSGLAAVLTAEDEATAAPFVVEAVIQAEREGVDAVVLDCTGDPGLLEARRRVAIPVVGPGELCRRLAGEGGRPYAWLDGEALSKDPLAAALAAIGTGARAVVVGATGRSDVADRLREELRERGHNVPVLDPLPSAVASAVDLARAARG